MKKLIANRTFDISVLRTAIASLTIFLLIIHQTSSIFAQELLPPPPPSTPESPETPSDPPPAPTAPPAPASPISPESDTDPVSDSTSSEEIEPSSSQPESSSPTTSASPGSTGIATGDTTNSGVVISQANTNIATSPTGATVSDSPSGIQVVNDGNGAESQNTGTVAVDTTSTTVQDNQASAVNDLTLDSTTGHNEASLNTGADANITTGDANVSGTSISALNTNVDGVMVSEFNIADTHQGDYVLDFAANCISGCSPSSVTAANTGNGAGSQNTAEVDVTTTNATFQTNDAAVGNTMVLTADSGYNTASLNTDGDANITTGDANVSASALTFANNNLAGNVVYGVVNIYGDLIGDIILPEEILNSCCLANITAANTGNGAGSQNTAEVDATTTDATFQTNEAVIENQLVIDANTGANSTSGNTGGSSSITTGDSTAIAQVLNVANSNIDGGNWWLVLVNQAGTWVGQILGAPAGTNYAGSPGTQFQVGPGGEINAVNSENGADSTSTAQVASATSQTTVQTNTAQVENNLQLSANTGQNSASYNTSGDSSIKTGDAQIVANIVNFVNNNVTGGGKLFVTVVNVFGSWLGDFVAPGTVKDTPPPAVGGAEIDSSHASGSSTPSSSGQNTSNSGEGSGSGSNLDNSPAVFGPVSPRRPRPFASTAVLSAQSLSEPEAFSPLEIPSAPAGKKIVKINLAWLLLALPVVSGAWLLRRRFLLSK